MLYFWNLIVKRSTYITFLLSILWSQPVDLSLEWTTNDGLFFSEELEAVIEEEISELYNILGIIVISIQRVRLSS